MIRTNETLNEMKEKVEKFMQEQESFQIRLSRLRAHNLLDYETVVLFRGYMNGLSSLYEIYQNVDFSDLKLREKVLQIVTLTVLLNWETLTQFLF